MLLLSREQKAGRNRKGHKLWLEERDFNVQKNNNLQRNEKINAPLLNF